MSTRNDIASDDEELLNSLLTIITERDWFRQRLGEVLATLTLPKNRGALLTHPETAVPLIFDYIDKENKAFRERHPNPDGRED